MMWSIITLEECFPQTFPEILANRQREGSRFTEKVQYILATISMGSVVVEHACLSQKIHLQIQSHFYTNGFV